MYVGNVNDTDDDDNAYDDEDAGDGAGEAIGIGQWPRVGLVGEGAVPVELEFVEHVRGGGSGGFEFGGVAVRVLADGSDFCFDATPLAV